jgi:hypothetical protein
MKSETIYKNLKVNIIETIVFPSKLVNGLLTKIASLIPIPAGEPINKLPTIADNM